MAKQTKTIHSKALLAKARAMRKRAYAPYSKYTVGAALLGKSGKVYLGCNVENASYGLAICAERNAVAQAVAAGEREFDAIAISASGPAPVPPCGMCRQTLAEFMPPETPVFSENHHGKQAHWTVGELLPYAFTKRFF
ncbi:MAG: cytidine deaminase [Deltaproteobacteria bacterium]|nr:cytidine deaminase [Deltaproteobacteria bacterium]